MQKNNGWSSIPTKNSATLIQNTSINQLEFGPVQNLEIIPILRNHINI